MTEVAYIPLKTADGAVLGHARVCGGTVVFQFRRAVQGQAVVLTDSGRFSGDLHGSVRMDGAVIAAAAIENGRVLCVGQTRGNALCADEVRRRLIDPAVEELRGKSAETAPLISNTGSNQDKSSPLSVVSVSSAPTEHAPVPLQPTRETIAQPAADEVQRTEAQSIPTHGDTPRQAEPVRETAGKLLHFTRAEDRVPPSVQESAADSESFMALLRRADAAFSRLNTPVLPLVTQEGARSAAQSERARETHASADAFRTALSGTKAEPSPQKPSSAQRPPADTAECASHRRAWDEQVEALLELPNAIARERCDNPFPHIFPGAQFVRISGSGVLEHLEGEWISGRERYRLFAVRGEYSPLPPRHLSGFTRFIRTRSGGYWVRVTERGART